MRTLLQIRILLLAQLGLGQHFSGLLTDGGVYVEVLEEDLGATGGRSAALGVILGLDVDGRLLFPETGVGLWLHVLGAAAVAVPEAAVDEDDGAVLGQHEVGLAGKVPVVEPVPVPFAPQLGPHNLLRGRVPGADAGHVVGALGGGGHFPDFFSSACWR